MTRKILIIAALIFAYGCSDHQYNTDITLGTHDYDVIVYGNSSAAITAAISAARNGVNVLIISENNHLGGLTTSGLTATDLNSYLHVGGISKEFYHRIYNEYLKPELWKYEDRSSYFDRSKERTYSGKNDKMKMQWVFESNVASQVFNSMLLEENVAIKYNSPIKSVIKYDKKIERIILQTGDSLSAENFIDASYGGDLMALADVAYTIQRESKETYGENYAGFDHLRNYPVVMDSTTIDPYIEKGVPASGFLPYLNDGDNINGQSVASKTQAYCYRLTLTDYLENRKEIEKPIDYDPLLYEYLIRRIQKDTTAVTLKNIFTITPMPNFKTDTNGIDFVGGNEGWVNGSYKERIEIERLHKTFTIGLIWFLQNDERVPHALKREVSKWGFAKDEFINNENFPPQLYIRESRRMIGDYVMTEQNCSGKKIANKSIGYGTYAIDSHVVQRIVFNGKVLEEGHFYKKMGNYQIDYDALVPKRSQCSNLFVPICLSSSHVAYGSIRMEPVFMILGHSVGTAAAICSKYDVSPKDLKYNVLKKQLLRENQIL